MQNCIGYLHNYTVIEFTTNDMEQYLRGIYLHTQPIFCHDDLYPPLGLQVKFMQPSSRFFTLHFLHNPATTPVTCCTSSTTQAVVDCEHCGKAIMYTCVYIISICNSMVLSAIWD